MEEAILETVEEEQRRIGHDLHDGLCQQLTGIALIAKALARKLSDGAPGESAEASEIAQLINESIDQTRDLARGLSPVEIEVAGLVPALQKFADTVERHHKIACVFVHDESPGLPYAPILANHLYRIVQEAVNNAIRHGKAKSVEIRLAVIRGRSVLTVQDDGIGFEEKVPSKPGLGLRSMRYRSRIIGAWFKIRRGANGGTIMSCSFPHRQGIG